MCDQCQMVSINGVNCHEIGCPNAKEDYAKRDGCQWCGKELSGDNYYFNGQLAFCDEDCCGCYYY